MLKWDFKTLFEKDGPVEAKEPKKKKYKDEDKINWFLIKTKDLKARIGVRISDSQAQAFEEGLDIKLKPSNSIVEKLDA